MLGTLITIFSGYQMYLMGAKNRWLGPAFGVLVSSPTWWLYVYTTQAWDLVPVNVMFHTIHSYNLWRVYRGKVQVQNNG